MDKIIGQNLSARPAQPDPNTIFIDLSTDKSYVFEDGTRQEIPVTAPKRLPDVTASDNGKALIVAAGKWDKAAIPSQLPAVTAEDAGKVLTVDAEGHWVAAALPSQISRNLHIIIVRMQYELGHPVN